MSRKISKNAQVPENNFFLFLSNVAKRPEKWSKKLKKIFPLSPIARIVVEMHQVHEKNFFSPNDAKRREKWNLK